MRARRAVTAPRLILINVFIRIAASASGQLFAFVLAERMGARAGTGSLLAGMIGVCYYLTEMVGAPLAGHIADVRGQLRVLRWGPMFGVAAVLLGAAAALEVSAVPVLAALLIAARLAEGASAACAVPTTLVLLSRATEREGADGASLRLRLMGVFEIASLGGLILGYLVAGIAWDSFGGFAFLLLPILYVAAWAITLGESTETRRPVRKPRQSSLRSILGLRAVTGFTVAWLAVNAVVGVWLQQAPFLLKLPLRSTSQTLVGGYSGSTIGVIFAIWGALFLTGIALWSLLAPRWPRRSILTVALGGMLVVVASLTLVNRGAPSWILGVAAIAVMVESGFTPAAFAYLADLTDAHESSRGTAMGVYSLLLGVGQLVGAVVGAPLAARWQMNGVLAATGLLALVALAGVARMKAQVRPQPPRGSGEA